MIAIDTNVLVHAHRSDSPFHGAATAALGALGGRWAIPWPCIHEFYAVVTHPRIFDPPTPFADALLAVDTWCASSPKLLGETEEHWPILADLLRGSQAVGPVVHDARIAALCLEHGIEELWTADRDFSRFPALRVRNPLVVG
ncbi:MAG TPA: TA system VapC family ribonuclease toxin [Anaeromyxobacter sp.]|nr:TA system VapC family ribonuclease toxin [Anaeromyxobacter sp.]